MKSYSPVSASSKKPHQDLSLEAKVLDLVTFVSVYMFLFFFFFFFMLNLVLIDPSVISEMPSLCSIKCPWK